MKLIHIDFLDTSGDKLGHIRDPEEFAWAKELKDLQDSFNWVRVRMLGRGRTVHGRRLPFVDFRNWQVLQNKNVSYGMYVADQESQLQRAMLRGPNLLMY